METRELRLSPPWVEYYEQVKAMFGEDPEIRINIDEDEKVVNLLVDNSDKAAALEKLLKPETVFGNVTVRTVVVPANQDGKTRAELVETALKGNPVFKFARAVDTYFDSRFTYIVLRNQVVQYPMDNLHDLHGNRSTLFEAIARDLIGEDEAVFFCTDQNGWKL